MKIKLNACLFLVAALVFTATLTNAQPVTLQYTGQITDSTVDGVDVGADYTVTFQWDYSTAVNHSYLSSEGGYATSTHNGTTTLETVTFQSGAYTQSFISTIWGNDIRSNDQTFGIPFTGFSSAAVTPDAVFRMNLNTFDNEAFSTLPLDFNAINEIYDPMNDLGINGMAFHNQTTNTDAFAGSIDSEVLNPVSEPETITLFTVGLLGLGLARKKAGQA